MQNAGVFLPKGAILELRIGDSLSTLLVLLSVFHSVEALRVLHHKVKPQIGFNLAEDVGMSARRDTFDRCLHLRERLEEVDYAF